MNKNKVTDTEVLFELNLQIRVMSGTFDPDNDHIQKQMDDFANSLVKDGSMQFTFNYQY